MNTSSYEASGAGYALAYREARSARWLAACGGWRAWLTAAGCAAAESVGAWQRWLGDLQGKHPSMACPASEPEKVWGLGRPVAKPLRGYFYEDLETARVRSLQSSSL